MKELIRKQPPDRIWPGMSMAFWLIVGQQEEIWKRLPGCTKSLRISRLTV